VDEIMLKDMFWILGKTNVSSNAVAFMTKRNYLEERWTAAASKTDFMTWLLGWLIVSKLFGPRVYANDVSGGWILGMIARPLLMMSAKSDFEIIS